MSQLKLQDLKYTCHQYGDNNLQRVGVWQHPKSETPQPSLDRKQLWLVYIHGGAWRDPTNTHKDFEPSITHFLQSDQDLQYRIKGFASIDYRLSPHPKYDQGPDTPRGELRDAKHPDHINDVDAALHVLQAEYSINGDYIIIGHSAGGTLAFQFLMNRDGKLPLPKAIITISGIYDLPGIGKRLGPIYQQFIGSAFGGADDQKKASPLLWDGAFSLKNHAVNPVPCLLAWSPEDTLIDQPEIDQMQARLILDGVDCEMTKDVKGEHDFLWQDGSQMPSLVKLIIDKL